MRIRFPIAIFTTILFSFNCSKSKNNPPLINCDGLITDTLGTNDKGRIYMPNAFTPNADGLNDIFNVHLQNISSIAFTIYDENNKIVFFTNQTYQGWNGTPDVNTTTKFYYKIQALTSSGKQIGQCGELYRVACIPRNVSRANLIFMDQLSQNGFTLNTSEVLSTCP